MSDLVDNFGESQPADDSPAGPVAGLSAGAKQFIRQYVPADDDSGCIASFEVVSVFQPFKSKIESDKQNRAVEIWDDVVFIRINIRGNDKLEVHRPARDEDKRRFPYAWQEFQAGTKEMQRGTPLVQLPGIDRQSIRAYNSKNVWTIEDLALVNDNNLHALGTGGRDLRRAAQEFVARASGKVDEDLKVKFQKAMELIERLADENEQLKATQKGKPGGKPKNEAA